MLIIAPLIFPVEIISNAFRLLSLSVRLYANMFVGKLLEHVFARLIPIGVPATMMALHVFVSFIQAYIFMLLLAVYISLAVAEEH
jgi:F-type H+-transporting ATPase subunit a